MSSLNPISSTENIPPVVPQNGTNLSEETNIARVANEAITDLHTGGSNPTKPLQASVSKGPSPIKKFFYRHLFSITDDDHAQVHKVRSQIADLNTKLAQATKDSHAAARAESKFSHRQYPTEESLKTGEAQLTKMQSRLAEAKTAFDALEKGQGEVQSLVEQHSLLLGDLHSSQIAPLKKKIEQFEKKVQVSEKLFALETAILTYSKERNFANFSEAGQKFQELLTSQAPSTSYQARTLTPIQLLKARVPSLQGHIDRLSANFLTMQKEQMQKLSKQLRDVRTLCADYNKLSKQISNLEMRLYDHSLVGIIYRCFHSEQELYAKLHSLRDQQKNIGEKWQETGKLTEGEAEWIERAANQDSKAALLHQDITAMRRGLKSLSHKQEIASKLDTLLEELQQYQESKNRQVRKGNFNPLPDSSGKIKESFSSLIQEVNNSLPLFLDLQKAYPIDSLDKLQKFLSVAFPTLRYRAQEILHITKQYPDLQPDLQIERTEVVLENAAVANANNPQTAPNSTEERNLQENTQTPPIFIPDLPEEKKSVVTENENAANDDNNPDSSSSKPQIKAESSESIATGIVAESLSTAPSPSPIAPPPANPPASPPQTNNPPPPPPPPKVPVTPTARKLQPDEGVIMDTSVIPTTASQISQAAPKPPANSTQNLTTSQQPPNPRDALLGAIQKGKELRKVERETINKPKLEEKTTNLVDSLAEQIAKRRTDMNEGADSDDDSEWQD